MQNYSYETWVMGGLPSHTTETELASGQGIIKARTPIGQNATDGKWYVSKSDATDGTQTALRITAFDVDTSGGATIAGCYFSGTYNPELVNWDESFTDVHKALAFAGTPICLQTPETGTGDPCYG